MLEFCPAALLVVDEDGPSDKRVPEVARVCLAALGNQLLSRNPITGIAGCCARPAIGHTVTATPLSSVMKSRRFIRSPRRHGASSVGGTSRPSALAVLRLITSSYLVGACTGKVGWLLAF
jgi:hypothetical protein